MQRGTVPEHLWQVLKKKLYFLTFTGPCSIMIYSYNKVNEMHYFSDLFDKVLYMFRTGPLSIIRSISTLYTQQYMLVLLAVC